MNTPGLERCQSYINCTLQTPGMTSLAGNGGAQNLAITISRQSGCGAHVVAEKLAGLLQTRAPGSGAPWTVFDRNLMEQVLAEHNLPERLVKQLPEDRVTELDDIMSELFGARPSTWTLVEKTAETILHLAQLGNVIVLGRGANIITARLPNVLHVRLMAALDDRVQHMEHFEGIPRKAALTRIHREDLGRKRYLRKYFEKDIDDPLLYHLVINTSLVPLDAAAELIAHALPTCCGKVPPAK